nr:putative RNA-directed DNA polymerase, eukaryota, reverse transcriptase zinc-binding domain protein [Tanacetum cinerariifolium]
MGDRRSNQDDVLNISTFFFVTNFPEQTTAKELWRLCKQYGNVIDVFIPNRRSKLGKRFGFVRFIKILDVVRLVNNLCTIWIGKFKLHVNIARFNRPLLNKSSHSFDLSANVKPASDASYKKVESMPSSSYIQTAKVGISSLSDANALKPALVLDDSCAHEPDLALSLVGKVFLIRVKELTGWAPSFNDDSNSDDESVDSHEASILKDEFSDKNSDMKEIPEIVLDKSEHVGNISPACNEVRMETRVEEKSEDPFNIYDTLNKKKPTKSTKVLDKEPCAKASFQEDVNVSGCSGHFQSVKAPKSGGSILHIIEDFIKVGKTIGYKMEGCIKDFEEIVSSQGTKVLDNEPGAKASFQEDVNVSGCSVHFQSAKAPKSGSSILYIIEDFIKVGKQWDTKWKDASRILKKLRNVRFYFHSRGAAAFNSFIVESGLVEVPSGGFSFTWSHRSATKMSRLDRFLVSEDLQRSCPNLSSLTLDRYLSDHRPILLRELNVDYSPTPFRFFHNWLDLDGFDSFISDTWCKSNIIDPNAMFKMAKKLKILKGHIRVWVKDKRASASNLKKYLKNKISNIDSLIDKRKVSSAILEDRLETMNKLASLENMESSELAQKAKVKWSIEDDENSKFFHGIINKRQNNLAIRGIMVDGDWMEDPAAVKREFFSHFQNRFVAPCVTRLFMDIEFPNRLSSDQALDLERHFSKEKIKGAVWDCGLDKLPGPDGFKFGFYRDNSSFIALIPKTQVTVIGNLVNDVQSAFIANRQILDGPFILIELIHWCKAKKKETMIFKVDFEKAFDFVCWDCLEDVLKIFGFGSRWCDWSVSCLKSSKGSVLVNGSPTSEFQFYKGLKQGDSLLPFLFILVMETLHLSFQNVVNAGLFKGVVLNNSLQLSHLFYADDAIFIGQWCTSNITAIIRVLECFFRASGLRINLQKSKLMGVAVENSLVTSAAVRPGVNVGGHMSRIASWDVVINKVLSRLSKWKMQVLSVGGRLTLLKSIKMMLVKWNNVLASKEMRGLGVSSFCALNRALIFKWVWRFRTQGNSIWAKVIKAMHGEYGNLDWPTTAKFPSNWLDIIRSFSNLYNKGVDLLGSIKKKVGNGENTMFWDELWKGEVLFKNLFPRLYALELVKNISVANKMAQPSVEYSFRRNIRGGAEQVQMASLLSLLEGLILLNMMDRWMWSISGDEKFYVSSVRNYIDDKILRTVRSKTQWCKFVPIKVKILSWRIKLNNLPTRLNLSRRGLELQTILCPSCNLAVESTDLFFS